MGNPAGNAVGNLVENIADSSVGQGEGEKVYLRKAVFGGNLAFGMGDGEVTNHHPAWEIWWKILQEILQEMLQEILQEILQ